MKTLCLCLCAITTLSELAHSAPANGFSFPDDSRREKKLEPIITPPVLPILEHLERDPSTLLPNETGPGFRNVGGSRRPVKPRFGGGFSVEPSGTGGLTASVSSSGSVGGASHSASQSFSFGFNNGFSGSQSASQAASFSGGFGNGFSGSQSSSQAAAFGGNGVSGSASQAAAFGGGGGGGSGSQSASSAFGFNSLGGFPNQPELNFGEGIIDARHRGVPGFPFPGFVGRSKGVGAAAFRSSKELKPRGRDDWLAVVVRDN